jgi:hypothetical protein
MADAAAEKEQAEFDLVIAEKENEIKLHEAAEKQRSLALKAQCDHEMIVLKAQQRAAMATAKISAIEQSLSEEKMSMRDTRSNDGDEERVRQWVKDQEHNLNPKPSHHREINPSAYKTLEIGRPTYLAADIEHPSYLDPSEIQPNDRTFPQNICSISSELLLISNRLCCLWSSTRDNTLRKSTFPLMSNHRYGLQFNIANINLHLLLYILLAGDIATNPGPACSSTYNCPVQNTALSCLSFNARSLKSECQ